MGPIPQNQGNLRLTDPAIAPEDQAIFQKYMQGQLVGGAGDYAAEPQPQPIQVPKAPVAAPQQTSPQVPIPEQPQATPIPEASQTPLDQLVPPAQAETPPATTEVKKYTFEAANGKIYGVEVDPSVTEKQAMDYLSSLPENQQDDYLYNPHDIWDKFAYGFKAGDNILENAQTFLQSHFPALAGEIKYSAEDGHAEFRDAQDMYGEDFLDLTPQQRRDRIAEVKQKELTQEYPDLNMTMAGPAGIAGGITKAIADPTALVGGAPTAAKGIYSAGKAAMQGLKIGAGWGAGYEFSKQLAEQGLPTTPTEGIKTATNMAKGAATGAVGGTILGATGYGISKAIPKYNKLRTFSDIDKLAKWAKEKYYPEMWQATILGDTSAEANSRLRAKYNLSLDDEWKIRKAVGNDPTYSPAYGIADAFERFGKTTMSHFGDQVSHTNLGTSWNNIVQPIDSAIKDVSKTVGQRLNFMETNILQKLHDYHYEIKPFIDAYRKMRKSLSVKERKNFAIMLYNKDLAGAKAMMSGILGRKGAEAFDKMTTALDQLGKEMKSVGMDYTDLENYFPRIVQDVEGLQTELGTLKSHLNQKNSLSNVLARAEKKLDRKLSEPEKIRIINNWMQYGSANKPVKSVSSLKKRRVKAVDSSIIDYYFDPISSIDLHLRDTISGIERRRFFGKDLNVTKDNLEKITPSVGALIKRYHPEMDAKDSNRIKSLLLSRFGPGERASSTWLQSLRTATGGITLGNPYSAIRQFADITANSPYFGLINTIKGLPRAFLESLKGQLGITSKADINADTLGTMMEMVAEIDSGGIGSSKIRRASNALYKYFGFKAVDRLGKNAIIQASLRRSRSLASSYKGKQTLLQEVGAGYDPKDFTQLVSDLKEGKVTDLVKQHVMAQLLEMQPVAKSRMPKAYLDMPNGRVLYQFRTWGLTQFDVVRNRVWRDLLSGNPAKTARAATMLPLLYVYIGMANVGLTELQRLITLRDPKTTPETFPMDSFMALMGNFMIDRYSMENALKQNDFGQFWAGFAPPAFEIPANLGLATWDAIKEYGTGDTEAADKHFTAAIRGLAPLRLFDYWFMGGAEKENEKLQKERESAFLKRMKQ